MQTMLAAPTIALTEPGIWPGNHTHHASCEAAFQDVTGIDARFLTLIRRQWEGATKAGLRYAFNLALPGSPPPHEGLVTALQRVSKARLLGTAIDACVLAADTIEDCLCELHEKGQSAGFGITLRRPSFTAAIELWVMQQGRRQVLWGRDYRADRLLRAEGCYGQGQEESTQTVGWEAIQALRTAQG